VGCRARVDFPGFGRLAFERPTRVLEARRLADVRPLLREVEAEAARGRWAAGLVRYEAAPAFDPALRVRGGDDAALAWFAVFDAPAPWDAPRGGARLAGLAPEIGRAAHAAALGAVREGLGRGDAYQVNLTLRLRGRFEGDPLALHERLRRGQGGGWGACLVRDGEAVVSASPELFLERRGDRLRVRPMKGTARRGRWEAEDDRAAAALRESPKDRAENVMIVDLLRNDLGRVAAVGSVEATSLFDVERYRTVLQLTSTVEARLRPGTRLDELLAALFPSGSVTGAPKVAAMRAIAALEPSPRGAYCGAVGLVAPGGDAAFNVAIRTVELDLDRGEARCGVGGGVTWDSTAAGEWDELLAKAAFLEAEDEPVSLVETLRLERGAYARLGRHLARLASSARHLGIALDERRVRAALDGAAASAAGEARRVRLLVGEDGAVGVEGAPLPAPAAAPLRVALARAPVRRGDRWLFHKTTRRAVYDARRAERADAFDVLLANEEGELTELTIGNLVAEIGGERLTPPRECGLLAGTFREELLARGEVREAVLRREDLGRARRLWLVNAVREWVPIEIGE
jgi:para-aminobenzoate synthetase/4-amino-4-deoxychorismate lyase